MTTTIAILIGVVIGLVTYPVVRGIYKKLRKW